MIIAYIVYIVYIVVVVMRYEPCSYLAGTYISGS